MKQTIRSLIWAISFAALGCPVLAAKGADSNADCVKLSDYHLSQEEVLALVHKCAPDAPASATQNDTTARVVPLEGDSVEDLPELIPTPGSNAPIATAPVSNPLGATSPTPSSPNHS
jgi:hypothetical protein